MIIPTKRYSLILLFLQRIKLILLIIFSFDNFLSFYLPCLNQAKSWSLMAFFLLFNFHVLFLLDGLHGLLRIHLSTQSKILFDSYPFEFIIVKILSFNFVVLHYNIALFSVIMLDTMNYLVLKHKINYYQFYSGLIYYLEIAISIIRLFNLMAERELFEDRFKVDKIDPDNKTPFRNVSRVHLISYSDKQNRRNIELDINIQIYPVSLSDSYLIKITNCDHVKNIYSQEDMNKPSEKDQYDYVMYGVVFELEEKGNQMVVYASFGGLLMRVSGSLDAMSGFRKDGKQARIYLMMRKA